MSIEAMKQALEGLEIAADGGGVNFYEYAKDLRQAIAEAEKQEPVAWVDLLKAAEQIVKDKFLYKRFIDGTPLANDVPVWMADFAQQYTHPQPKREWVGLTVMEAVELELATNHPREFAAAIEAKLKAKNGY